MPDIDARSSADNVTSTAEREVIPAVNIAFARLHKAAFGVATGVAGALFIGAITLYVLTVPRAQGFPLGLVGQYFAGYSVSWTGLVVGMGWGFITAFVAGWFVAFCRNLSLAIIALVIRTRAELSETRTFLDHI